jgi:hypothetical protein
MQSSGSEYAICKIGANHLARSGASAFQKGSIMGLRFCQALLRAIVVDSVESCGETKNRFFNPASNSFPAK